MGNENNKKLNDLKNLEQSFEKAPDPENIVLTKFTEEEISETKDKPLVKKEQIKYIFFEELVSPKIAETIAKEAGVKTLVLNPVEGLTKAQQEKKLSYLDLMQQNLANLKIALESK